MPKISIGWVGCTNVTDRRQTTDGRTTTYSELEHEFTFAKNGRKICLVFWEEEWFVGATPSTWNFGSTGSRLSEFADFEPIFAPSASAVTPSERTSITLIGKSTMRFPMSLRWSSYVAPKPSKGRGLKNAKRPIFIALRKSATKFLCVKTVSGKVVRHSLA